MRIHGSRTPFTKTLNSGLLGLTLLGAMAAGCSSTAATVQQKAAAQPQGSVRLEEVADWEFEAIHPNTIALATLDSLLRDDRELEVLQRLEAAVRGVMISDAQTDLSNLPVDGSKPMKVFSDEDVHYLAPLLAQALSQAQPEYVVAFRLSSSAGSGSEPTAGTLYVQNERLYLTVTEHNGTLAKVESSLFSSGRPARIVSITPESAGKIEQALPAIAQGRQPLKSLAIDYKLFAKNPEPAPAVAATIAAPAPQPVQTSAPRMVVASVVEEAPVKNAPPAQAAGQDAREAMARKDAKISALRRDLESMRTQLETKDKELRAVKSTPQTQPKRETRNKAELTVR